MANQKPDEIAKALTGALKSTAIVMNKAGARQEANDFSLAGQALAGSVSIQSESNLPNARLLAAYARLIGITLKEYADLVKNDANKIHSYINDMQNADQAQTTKKGS